MTIYVFAFVFFLLVLFPHSRIPRIVFLLGLSYFAYSYIDLADYDGYEGMYDASRGNSSGQYFLDNTEVGFRYLVYAGNFFGFTYPVFKAIAYFCFGCLYVHSLVKLNPKSANLTLSLYLIYPMLLDLVQVRHFMAMSLFLYAFTIFLDSVKYKKTRFMHFINFVPSILLHKSFLFLFILIPLSYGLLYFVNKKQFLLKIFLIMTLILMTLFASLQFFKLTSVPYFQTSTSFASISFFLFIYFISFVFLVYVYKKYSHVFKSELTTVRIEYLRIIIIYTALLVSILMPLMFFSVEFFRFFRVEYLILLSITLSYLLSNFTLINKINVFIIYSFHICFAFTIYYMSYLDSVVFPWLFTS